MKPFYSAVVLVALTAGCASAPPPPVSDQSARQVSADTRYYASNRVPTKPPRLSVGVSDPNTQLILPWFLTDIINAVNDP